MSARSQEEWRKVLAEYRSSKGSVSSFCKRRQISKSALYYRLAKKDAEPAGSFNMLPVITSESSAVDSAELLMPRGMSLRFSPGASACYVADIIKALAWVR